MTLSPRAASISSVALALMACRMPAPEAEPSTVPTSVASPMPTPTSIALLPALDAYLDARVAEIDAIPAERREALEQLAKYVIERRAAGQPARLLFICTHNSRRSHMGQLWAAAAAAYYGIDGVESYSGGTETTAFNPRAVAAMQRAGFEISMTNKSLGASETNPRYEVRLAEGTPPQLAFSKTWDDSTNPSEGFAAVMTCSQADEACPLVRGAQLRLSLPYDDPKVADDTPEEAARYDERAGEIATHMLLVFREVAAATP